MESQNLAARRFILGDLLSRGHKEPDPAESKKRLAIGSVNSKGPMQVPLLVKQSYGVTRQPSLLRSFLKPPAALPAVRHRSGKASKRRSKAVPVKPPTSQTDKRTNQQFVDIINRSNEKLRQRLSGKLPDLKFNAISEQSIRIESTKPIEIGDLIWNGRAVEMVVYLPQKYNDHVLAMNMRGVISEHPWQHIRTRLGPALCKGSINIPLSKLIVDEITESEVAFDQMHSCQSASADKFPELASQEKSYNSVRAVGKAVQSPIFLTFASQLRKIQLEIEAMVSEWKHTVTNYVRNEMQHPNNTVIIPLLDFADAVKRRMMGNKADDCPLSPLEYCVVQICLDSDDIQFDVQQSVSFTSPNSLVIYPGHLSKELLNFQYDSEVSTEYLKYYARNELNHPISESTALAELRRRFPNAERLDPDEATELLHIPDGGMWEKLSYKWLYHTALTNQLTTQPGLPDAMASIREEYTDPVYCIDSKKVKVAEDGISVEETSNPHEFRIGVHVSNPSAFMNLGGASFLENIPLVGTIMENERAWRMLPFHFTREVSLNAPNQPSLSVFALVNLQTGEVSNCEVKPLTLTNIRNYTTDELTNDKLLVNKLWEFAKWRITTKFSRGAFCIDDYENTQLLLNDDLKKKHQSQQLPLVKSSLSQSRILVEECMLFANELIGEFCKKHQIPILYRTRNMLLPSKQIWEEFEHERVANNGFVGAQWRKVVSGTRLSTKPGAFADSGAPVYTRFTSPLRRLEDLIVHHQIQGHLTKNSATPSPQFSRADLDKIKDQLELRQQIVQSLFRDVLYLQKFNQAAIQPEMKVLGVVVKNVEENRKAAIYVPQLELYVDYVGERLLPLGHVQEFLVTRVMSYARKIYVK